MRGSARIYDVRTAQFVLKIEKLSHIIGARGSQGLRSSSPIMAPVLTCDEVDWEILGTLFATICHYLLLFATIRHYSGLFAVRYSRLFAMDRFHVTSSLSKIQNERATKVFVLIRHKRRYIYLLYG